MVKSPEISERSLTIFLIIIILTINVIGGELYGTSYFPNFIAEFAGIFTGILITLVLINRFNRIQRNKQWKKVKILTLDSLTIYLQEFLNETFMQFNYSGMDVSPTTPKWKDIDKKSVAQLKLWIDELNRNKDKIVCEYTVSDKVVEWYKVSENDLSIIRNVLFPRILEISEDNELIDSLIDFDAVMMDLNINIKGYLECYHIDLFPVFIDAINKIQAVLKVIVVRKEN